ncbi:MAG: thioredoxin domain-containing protein [Chloroflexota bacterium]
MPNHLAGETSPYLLQHAHNPVDWYPWGAESLGRAKNEDKPILLSIGYSACHWCHVMAHESFENPEIARLMNQSFINIKVDREERPDLDTIYMEAVQSMTGRGGWPLTVFLTPDGKPFYGGTYFPPEDRQGLAGFPRILSTVAGAYRDRRGEIDRAAEGIAGALATNVPGGASGELSVAILDQAYAMLKPDFDWENGGFGGAPKFPQPMALEFLLRYYHRTRDPDALMMVTLSLEKMAAGGLYDQLGGGFHRYATDHIWLVPHFEKMLYDNALLSRLYLQAFVVTGRREFRRIAEEVLDYILKDMTNPEGGFYSTRDADSEGAEGRYYLWTPEEIIGVLGGKTGNLVNDYYGVTASGNFEGSNILHLTGELEAELPRALQQARTSLLDRREQRVPPGRDEKVIASWNGLMLASLAEAACMLDRRDYADAAVKNGKFLLKRMTGAQYLVHTWKDGRAGVDAFLDDYALVIDGLISLHEATFSVAWLGQAIRMAEIIIDDFWDESAGRFYDAGRKQEGLFVRPGNAYDNAVPSGASSATLSLIKIARITGREDMEKIATKALTSMSDLITRHPLGFGKWLCALDLYLSPRREIVVSGRFDDKATQALRKVLYDGWLPNRIVVGRDPAEPSPLSEVAIREEKPMIDGKPTVYVCDNFTCQAPVTSPDGLRGILTKE